MPERPKVSEPKVGVHSGIYGRVVIVLLAIKLSNLIVHSTDFWAPACWSPDITSRLFVGRELIGRGLAQELRKIVVCESRLARHVVGIRIGDPEVEGVGSKEHGVDV